jgi:hypothetical protein
VQVFGPDIIQDTKKQVHSERKNLKVAQSHPKSYVDRRRRELSFKIRDFIYHKLSPMRGLR